MKQIRKFAHLPITDQGLLLKSALWLSLITLGLRLVSFRTLQRLLDRAGQTSRQLPKGDQRLAKRLTWSVQVASQYIPAAVCLPQALTVQLLYRRAGYPAHLKIGVVKNKYDQLEAHAWVESQGRVVIGGEQDLSRYSLLPSLEITPR